MSPPQEPLVSDKIRKLMADPRFQALSPERKIIVLREAAGRTKVEGPPKQEQGELSAGVLEALGIPEGDISQAMENLPRGLKHMFGSPLDTIKLLGGAALEGQKEQLTSRPLRTMLRKEQEGRPVAGRALAAAHSLLGLIPLVGPFVGETSEGVATGEISPNRALGRAVGVLGAEAVARGAAKTPLERPVGEIPFTSADVATGAKGNIARTGQAIVERSLPGSIGFEPFRIEQQAALLDKAGRITKQIADGDFSPTATGKAVVADLVTTVDELKTEASRLYGEIDRIAQPKTRRAAKTVERPSESGLVTPSGEPAVFSKRVLVAVEEGGVFAETAPLKRFAVKELRRLRKVQKVIDPKIFEQAQSNLEAIVKSPKRVTFQTMQDVRSELLSITRRIDSAVGSKSQGIAKKFASLADESMKTAADTHPELRPALDKANKFWAETARKVEESFDVVTDAAKARPEDIGRQLSALPLQTIRDIRGALRPETWSRLKAAWLQEGLLQAIQGESLRAELGAFGASPAIRGEIQTLKPGKLRNWLEGQGKRTGGVAQSRLREILAPEELAQIEGLLDDALRAQPSKGGIFLPIFNTGLLAAAATAVARLDPTLATQVGGISATLYLTSKLMTSVEGLRAYRKFLQSSGNAQRQAFWAQRLNNIAQQEVDRDLKQSGKRGLATIKEQTKAKGQLEQIYSLFGRQ